MLRCASTTRTSASVRVGPTPLARPCGRRQISATHPHNPSSRAAMSIVSLPTPRSAFSSATRIVSNSSLALKPVQAPKISSSRLPPRHHSQRRYSSAPTKEGDPKSTASKPHVYSALAELTDDERRLFEPLADLVYAGRNKEAVQWCRTMLEKMDKKYHAILHVQLGDALSAVGEAMEAVDCYRSALSLQPSYGEAHYRLGLLYFKLAEASPSAEYKQELAHLAKDGFIEASKLLDTDPAIPHALAQLYIKILRDNNAAIAEAKEALKRDSSCSPAYMLLANAYYRMENWPAAIDALNKFYDGFPAFYRNQKDPPPFAELMSEALLKRATCYFKISEFSMADTDFSTVINLAEASEVHKAFAYSGRAGAHFARKTMWKALDDYTSAIQLQPQLPEPYKLRAVVNDALGKREAAAKDRDQYEFLQREKASGVQRKGPM